MSFKSNFSSMSSSSHCSTRMSVHLYPRYSLMFSWRARLC